MLASKVRAVDPHRGQAARVSEDPLNRGSFSSSPQLVQRTRSIRATYFFSLRIREAQIRERHSVRAELRRTPSARCRRGSWFLQRACALTPSASRRRTCSL